MQKTDHKVVRRAELIAQADRAQERMGPNYGTNVTRMTSEQFKSLVLAKMKGRQQ